MAFSKDTRTGVTAFGYVENLKTFVKEANSFLEDSGREIKPYEINHLVDQIIVDKKVDYRDKFGKKATESSALYAIFHTNINVSSGEELIAYYDRPRVEKNWSGIFFCTESMLKKDISDNLLFRIGDLVFDTWKDGLQFLEELSKKSIPEKWTYQSHKSGIPHPILKSYIENMFEKLKRENGGGKLLKSDDGKYLIFNSGLLDKFFHEIYIIVHVKVEGENTLYRNPYILSSLTDLTRVGFESGGKRIIKKDDLPIPAKFFNNINEVIFHSDIEIDRNYDKFTHIIEDRRERFPKDEQEKDTTELARKLDNSIDYAIAIANRNYKLVVPQYRPQEDKLQLLMPIYLGGSFTKKPDFALVLDLEDGIYIPETILPLDAAYQNARLIAKPDELWLNPDDI